MGELQKYDPEVYGLAHTYMRGGALPALSSLEATSNRNDTVAKIVAGDREVAAGAAPYLREQALSLKGTMDREHPVPDLATRPDMIRMDGTRKGTTGFYGNIRPGSRGGMTEVSRGGVGYPEELFGPSIAPGLTQEHLNYINSSFSGQKNPAMDREIGMNAQKFISARRANGESPFFRSGYDLPAKVLSNDEFAHAGILDSIRSGKRW